VTARRRTVTYRLRSLRPSGRRSPLADLSMDLYQRLDDAPPGSPRSRGCSKLQRDRL